MIIKIAFLISSSSEDVDDEDGEDDELESESVSESFSLESTFCSSGEVTSSGLL